MYYVITYVKNSLYKNLLIGGTATSRSEVWRAGRMWGTWCFSIIPGGLPRNSGRLHLLQDVHQRGFWNLECWNSYNSLGGWSFSTEERQAEDTKRSLLGRPCRVLLGDKPIMLYQKLRTFLIWNRRGGSMPCLFSLFFFFLFEVQKQSCRSSTWWASKKAPESSVLSLRPVFWFSSNTVQSISLVKPVATRGLGHWYSPRPPIA